MITDCENNKQGALLTVPPFASFRYSGYLDLPSVPLP